MRRDARTEAQKEHVTAAANEHKQGVFADRAAGRRLMLISESSCRQGEGYSPECGILYLSLDGMDQASRPAIGGGGQRFATQVWNFTMWCP